MSTTVNEVQPGKPRPDTGSVESPVPAAFGVALCLLLALGQVALAGYQLGAGNQAIQVAFLKHYADPALFAHDDMLLQTMPLYPTYFFRLLAPLLPVAGLEPLYLMLQVLTSFFTLSAVYLLGRSIFKSHTAALVAAALLVAGHHRALAGEWLYTAWFTHTLVALPLALVAVALAYRGGGHKGRWRMVGAFAVAGLLFNLHALTAAYTILMMGLALFADVREIPLKKWLQTVLLCAAASALLAAPTLLQMLSNHQVFDAAWVNLMRVRSADHSFPSSWWAAADPEIPRFVLIFALFVLSWSFSPVRRPDTARALRVTILMTVGVALLFAAGLLFTEIWPLPLVIRLQPFRASRLMLVLMLVHIAYGAVEGIRAAAAGRAMVPPPSNAQNSSHPNQTPATEEPPSRVSDFGFRISLSLPARIMEMLAGLLVLLTLGLPALLPLLPLAVLIVLAAALVSGRLSITQTLVAIAALLVAFLANRQIQFAIPLLSADLSVLPRQWTADWLAFTALLAAIAAALLIAVLRAPILRVCILIAILALGTWGSWDLFHRDARPGAGRLAPSLAGAADWARTSTPKDAIFLAPTGLSGFRIFAERGLVADWRDGTQLYFSAAFGPDWLARISAIEPGLLLSPDGSRLVARGRSLDTLDDDELLDLAQKYQAAYILLPTPPKTHPRTLEPVYADAAFTAYLPKISPTQAAIPQGVINPADWTAMEKFMAATVAPNIEKNRKADITVQIVDTQGRPVQDLSITLEQTSHAFLFGCSLSFFEPNSVDPLGDQKAPPVTPAELKLFPTLFNASMIPFVGKWLYIEPQEGQRNFSDLDKYMDYCQANHIAVEYHFLTGLLPGFLRKNPAATSAKFPAHAREVVARYHDKVAFWQVTNDKILLKDTPAIFKEFREKYPGIQLGMSDCMRFYSDKKDPKAREAEMYKGFDGLVWLKSQGVTPDFFSVHGHYPVGLWADPRTMYELFDRFQDQGVKVHVSEMFLPLNTDLAGPVRKGKWSPDMQADYFERFLQICFSHPDVEMVNLWGMVPQGWGGSSGVLDESKNPRPAFYRMKKLFQETWHTRVQTTLPLDGIIAARAFHGGYQLTLALPGDRQIQTTLNVPQKPSATFKFRLDAVAGTLTNVE